MKIFITLDYELFFGSETGTPENCMIQPTKRLLDLVEPLGIRFTCFVDSGYLLALERQRHEFELLGVHFGMVADQLQLLSQMGHGIELHIHPHWEDSFFNGRHWEISTKRYRLSAFGESKICEITQKHAAILERITGRPPVAYRAGGWSAQPFAPIGRALETCGIFVDSSVFPGGHYRSEHQQFDFRSVSPYTTEYRFSDDLTMPDPGGKFTEIPISACRVSPLFYWRLAGTKVLKSRRHKAYGDGHPIRLSKGYFEKLTRPSVDVVSIDGYKCRMLKGAFEKYVRQTSNRGNFVMLGHPKAFTSYSLDKLQDFLKQTAEDHQYVTYQ